MKNFTPSIRQVYYYLVPQTITRSVLISILLLASAMNTMAAPISGTDDEDFRVVTFSLHPAPRTVCDGSATSFTVTASGTGALTYQWQVSTNGGGAWNPVSNGSTYANVGTATLSILVATSSMHNFQYRCQVTDNSGSLNSNPAQLTIIAPPTVKTGFGSESICNNGGGSISAQIFADLTYQWQVSNDGTTWNNLTDVTPYSGTASGLLVISNGTSLDGNLYRYVATNTVTGCQATSDHDTLKVYQPSITTPPSATINACAGGNATLSVTASSPLALTYQWSRQGTPPTPLTETAPYSGTATNTLTITGATLAMHTFGYLVAVTDSRGCVSNASSTLYVYSPLTINTHPRDTFACANINIGNAFRVTVASGSGPLTYQWQTDNGTNGVTWSDYNAPVNTSSTTSILSFSPATMTMNGYKFRVAITAACGTIFSNPATLRVLADGTWRGTTNTNWHTASNWCGGVPTSTTDVLIPEWAPRMPVISNATGTAFSRALHIEPAARLTISGGTTSMSGPFNIEGTVAYTAVVDQPVLPANHGSLEINGSGNKYMQSNIDISNNLVLGGTAKLVTGTNILTMKAGSNPISGATFNGTNITSWIVTGNGGSGSGNTGLGGLRIEQVNAADGAVLYPVGATPAAYNPLLLTNTGAIDNFTVAVNDQVIPGGILQSGIDRTWLVGEATPGGSNIALELRWADAEELSLFNRTATEVIRSDGSNIVQTSSTAAASGTDPFSRAANAFTVLTQFSVASHAAMLPIQLSAFNAQIINKTTAGLKWKTDGRDEGGVFVVQKLSKGPSFTDIGAVNNEAGKTNYSFTDYNLGTGISQYRLKMTEPGQQDKYSKSVHVNNPLTNYQIELRPSVTNKEQTSLYLNLSSKDQISITIIDMMGRVQLNKVAPLDKGEHYLSLPISHLAKGVYHVRITGSATINQSLHLVKQ